MEGKIRAQAETGIDGSYIDWTHIAEETSYDTYSRLGFINYLKKNLPAEVSKEKYGITDFEEMNLPQKRGDKFWMEWTTYRGYQVAEFHKHMRDVARKYNPDFMISGNVFGGFGYGPIAYLGAGNMEMLARDGYDDFTYSEMQEWLDSAPRNKDGIKITNSPALKFLTPAAEGEEATPRPFVMGDGWLTGEPVLIQVFADHGGGNPRTVYLSGKLYRIDSLEPETIWTDAPRLRERRGSFAHYRGCGLVPAGKAYRITRVEYRALLDPQKGKHSDMVIRIAGKEEVKTDASEGTAVSGAWSGDVLILPGREEDVSLTCSMYGLAEMVVYGALVDEPGAKR